MKAVWLALAMTACGDSGAPVQPDAVVTVDAPPAGPVDFATHIGTGPYWCKINDRAMYGLSGDLDAELRAGTFDWCPQDKNCDDICGAWLGGGGGSGDAEYFIACDPVAMTLTHPACTPQ